MTLSHKSFDYCSLYETKQHSMILILDYKLCSNPADAAYLQFQLSKLSVSLTVRSISEFSNCLYLGDLKCPSRKEDQSEAEVRTSIWKPAWETVIINSLLTDHSRWKIGPAAESNIFSTLGGFAFNWVFQTHKITFNYITQQYYVIGYYVIFWQNGPKQEQIETEPSAEPRAIWDRDPRANDMHVTALFICWSNICAIPANE